MAISLFFALYLQRFGISTSGGAFISLGQIVVLFAGLYFLFARRTVVDLTTLVLFSLFLCYGLFVTAWSLGAPQNLTSVAPRSLILVITLYAVICFRPTEPDRTENVLRYFNGHMCLIGVLGICQFALQFVGVSFFSFRDFIPDQLLIEQAYNVTIPLNYGSQYLKGNGVFFLEPSLFSQFAAVALATELLFFRRPGFVGVFAASIVVSYSGSGPLILMSTLLAMSVIRPHFAKYLLAFAAAVAAFLTIAAVVAPDVYTYYVRRAFEFQSSGSSGYLRYVTPYIVLDTVADGAQLFFGFGPGAAEKFDLGFDYTVNAVVKIVLDYGIFGAILFFGFLGYAFAYRSEAFLVVLCMCWYFLGGGYHLTSSVVHMLAVFLVWSVPQSRTRHAAPYRPATRAPA